MITFAVNFWLLFLHSQSVCVNGVGAGCGPAEQPIIVILD